MPDINVPEWGVNKLFLGTIDVNPSQWPNLSFSEAYKAELKGSLHIAGTLTGTLGPNMVGKEQLKGELVATLVTNGDNHDHSDGDGAPIKHSSLELDGGRNPHGTTAADISGLTAKLVTNGDNHDHSGGDGAKIKHSSLELDGGRNPHGITAADIQALPIAGGRISGDLQVSGSSVFSGKVGIGIGTTNPAEQLEVKGRIKSDSLTLGLWPASRPQDPKYMFLGVNTLRHDASGAGNYALIQAATDEGGEKPGSTYLNSPVHINFSIANQPQMILANNGNVGIGTTNPTHKFHVSAQDAVGLFESTGNQAFLRLYTNEGADNRVEITNRPGGRLSLFTNPAGDVLNITKQGRVGIGITDPQFPLDVAGSAHATGFTVSSDDRFKTNVTPLTNVLEKLEKIHGVSFTWNELYQSLGRSSGHREIGVIAQEMEAIFPELVTTWGNDDYKAMDYGRLTAVLVEGIKELKAENAALKLRVEKLEEVSGNDGHEV